MFIFIQKIAITVHLEARITHGIYQHTEQRKVHSRAGLQNLEVIHQFEKRLNLQLPFSLEELFRDNICCLVISDFLSVRDTYTKVNSRRVNSTARLSSIMLDKTLGLRMRRVT